MAQGAMAAGLEEFREFTSLRLMIDCNQWESSVMSDWKAPIPERKGPGPRRMLGSAMAKINSVIALLIIFGLLVVARAYLRAAADFAMPRGHPTFAQELHEQLSISFIGSGIGLAFWAFVACFAFVIFEAPMLLYWAALGCGSAYIGWLYFGGRALGQ
jgi:hypothetical protein